MLRTSEPSDVESGDGVDRATLQFDPFDATLLADPHSCYAAYRKWPGVQRSELGFVTLWRYSDVRRALSDSWSVEDATALTARARSSWLQQTYPAGRPLLARGGTLLDLDAHRHRQLRRLVASCVFQASQNQMAAAADVAVAAALTRLFAGSEVDFANEVAYNVPYDVISQILGIPSSARYVLRPIIDACTLVMEPISSRIEAEATARAVADLSTFVAEEVRRPRRLEADDAVSRLLEAHRRGKMSLSEVEAQVVLALFAGFETTATLLAGGLLTLIEHPVEYEALLSAPDLLDGAVDEMLRFVSPVHYSRRIATRDTVINGVKISRGSFVFACLASANRDEAFWGSEADTFQPLRAGSSTHLAFGGGAHRCLGAQLARVEARAVFGALLATGRTLALRGEPVWRRRLNMRGLEELWVAVS